MSRINSGGTGTRAASTSRPATPLHSGTLHCRQPLRPAALARCRILRGPCSAAGCVRHRRGEWEEDKGREERGDPDRGLISSNFEGFFLQNSRDSHDLDCPCARSDGRERPAMWRAPRRGNRTAFVGRRFGGYLLFFKKKKKSRGRLVVFHGLCKNLGPLTGLGLVHSTFWWT